MKLQETTGDSLVPEEEEGAGDVRLQFAGNEANMQQVVKEREAVEALLAQKQQVGMLDYTYIPIYMYVRAYVLTYVCRVICTVSCQSLLISLSPDPSPLPPSPWLLWKCLDSTLNVDMVYVSNTLGSDFEVVSVLMHIEGGRGKCVQIRYAVYLPTYVQHVCMLKPL